MLQQVEASVAYLKVNRDFDLNSPLCDYRVTIKAV